MQVQRLRSSTKIGFQKLQYFIGEVILATAYYPEDVLQCELQKFSLENIERVASAEDDYLFICTNDDNTILGFLSAYADSGIIWIDWLGVDKNHRQAGVAHTLVKVCENFAQENHFHKIWLDTRSNNKESISFFKKCNYTQLALLRKHWYGLDYYLWEKALP